MSNETPQSPAERETEDALTSIRNTESTLEEAAADDPATPGNGTDVGDVLGVERLRERTATGFDTGAQAAVSSEQPEGTE